MIFMNSISDVIWICDASYKSIIKSFCGYIRHLVSYQLEPLSFIMSLLPGSTLRKFYHSNPNKFNFRYWGIRDLPPSVRKYNGTPMETLHHLNPVKRICAFEHSVMTNFNCACPAIERGQGSGFLSEGSSWLTACMSEQRRFWRDCADAQARLNLRCSPRR